MECRGGACSAGDENTGRMGEDEEEDATVCFGTHAHPVNRGKGRERSEKKSRLGRAGGFDPVSEGGGKKQGGRVSGWADISKGSRGWVGERAGSGGRRARREEEHIERVRERERKGSEQQC